jgi:hypothetical protein
VTAFVQYDGTAGDPVSVTVSTIALFLPSANNGG